ncbi:hypothetical protein ACHAPT_010282 [Fusarium lateritium]
MTPGTSDAIDFEKAIEQGNIEAVTAHIDNGADVNRPFPSANTPLQTALKVAEPRTECIKLLLHNDANVYDIGVGPYRAPLVMAVVGGLDDALDLMVDWGCVENERGPRQDLGLRGDLTILHVAVCCRNRRALERLLESPAKEMVNRQDARDRTPLHFATKTYHEAFDILRWAMVSPCERPPTPAMADGKEHEYEIAQLLVNHGARADIPDDSGRTAMQNSLSSFKTDKVAKILFEASIADPYQQPETWMNALREAHILYHRGPIPSFITTSEVPSWIPAHPVLRQFFLSGRGSIPAWDPNEHVLL